MPILVEKLKQNMGAVRRGVTATEVEHGEARAEEGLVEVLRGGGVCLLEAFPHHVVVLACVHAGRGGVLFSFRAFTLRNEELVSSGQLRRPVCAQLVQLLQECELKLR